MEELEIKKMVKEVFTKDYSKARETVKGVIETKIQKRIQEAMRDE